MPNETKAGKSKSRASLFAVLQMVISIVIYVFVTAILWIYFESELSKLRIQLQHFETSLNQDFDGVVTEEQRLLKCCSANEETLLTLITTIVEEEQMRWNREHTTDGNQITLGAIERFVEYLINRNKTQSHPSSGSGSIIPVATHVTGARDCFQGGTVLETTQTGSKVKVGRWEATYGTAFNENVLSDGHHLIVPKSGLYHVYSQAYFQDYREDDQEDTEYVHYTVLDSPSYSADTIDLMKSVRIEDGISDYYSSFHSGLFKLREGDKIFMKVYLPSSEVKLDCSQESTYMGMYLVNDNLII